MDSLLDIKSGEVAAESLRKFSFTDTETSESIEVVIKQVYASNGVTKLIRLTFWLDCLRRLRILYLA